MSRATIGRAIAAAAVAAGAASFAGSAIARAEPATPPVQPVTAAQAVTVGRAVAQARAVTPAHSGVRRGPACQPYPSGTSLGVTDNGRRFCVQLQSQIAVALSEDPSPYSGRSQRWSAIRESGRALQERSQPIVATPGTTLGRFQAIKRGVATLSSTRAVCPPNNGGPTCHSVQGWQVTIVVGG